MPQYRASSKNVQLTSNNEKHVVLILHNLCPQKLGILYKLFGHIRTHKIHTLFSPYQILELKD
ncbi:hypothetical protein GIB67_012920, partial [Kingdonia uniflora]